MFVTRPAPGSSTDGVRTISATTGFASARRASVMSEAGSAAFAGSIPVGSTSVMPGRLCRVSHARAATAKTRSFGHTVLISRSV